MKIGDNSETLLTSLIYFLLNHPAGQALITKLEIKTLIEILLFI